MLYQDRRLLRMMTTMLSKYSCFVLQPENVLLLSKNRQHIKLIDFGLSREITQAEEVRDLMGE